MNAPRDSWTELNQHYLTGALAAVRRALDRHAARGRGEEPPDDEPALDLGALAAAMPAPPAIETLCVLFGLSPFERDVLLLCAGMELDAHFAPLCAAAQGDPRRAYPTFSLALAALPDPHWSALTPSAPLRRWRLVEAGNGDALTLSPLRIDERVLHFLAGVYHLDERLAGIVEPVEATGELTASQQEMAARLAGLWGHTPGARLPAAQLCGEEQASLRTVCAAACALAGLNLFALPAQAIPLDPRELAALARLWEREAALSMGALLIECGELDTADAAREFAVTRLAERIGGVVIIAGRERRALPLRPLVTLDLQRPDAAEQHILWQQALGDAALSLNGQMDALTTQFSLSEPTIVAACAEALGRQAADGGDLDTALWASCRAQARPRLENLAQRIAPAANWGDLVLPESQLQTLREIGLHIRERAQVYERWGFAAKSGRGLGISALFAGPSGAGKTMAAEVLAGDLGFDLYRIDLSQVVSKYIGETEKNLRRVFAAAEGSGAILLFDEADALFGRRSEVKDSHDRYANVEISYLLQRMESYRGLAILTTNIKEALDPAFMRRIRFIINFPFPDAAQRAAIWRRIFPAATPVDGLAFEKLARLSVTGGTIRNIALSAAFLAAGAGEAVGMAHLLRAARAECAKLERQLSEAECGGWV